MNEEPKLTGADVELLRTCADLRLRCLKMVEDKNPSDEFSGKLILAETLFEFATQGLQKGADEEDEENDEEEETDSAAVKIDNALSNLIDTLNRSAESAESFQEVLAEIAENSQT